MVRDALEVADDVQDLCAGPAVLGGEVAAAELDEIGAQHVLILVGLPLGAADGGGGSGVILPDELAARLHGVHGDAGHRLGHLLAAAQRHGGGSQQTLVQDLDLVVCAFRCILAVGDQAAGQLLQQPGEREEQGGTEDVKDTVDDGDAQLVDGSAEEGEVDHGVDAVKHGQPDRRADDVEHQVDHRGAAGVLVGPHRGQHGRDAGADVLAHDDGDGGPIGHLPRGRERLQNTHGSGRALDDGGQDRTGGHAQDGVAEHEQDVAELRHVLQPGHGAAHGVHAEHQDGKAQEDRAGVLLLVVLCRHGEDHADEGQDRGKRSGLEQLDEKAPAVQTRQAQDPGRDGGADVGAHDDADGLAQGEQTGVYKAHHHDRGGGRTLDDCRHAQARQKAQKLI